MPRRRDNGLRNTPLAPRVYSLHNRRLVSANLVLLALLLGVCRCLLVGTLFVELSEEGEKRVVVCIVHVCDAIPSLVT